MIQKTIIDGLEMTANHGSPSDFATFSYAKCQDGYEILMHFRGIRRFAFCTHENDAQFIVSALTENQERNR